MEPVDAAITAISNRAAHLKQRSDDRERTDGWGLS
jgi:hypothetical protein